MKQLGVIGGLGPKTGCLFCLNVNNKVLEKTSIQPDIVMENVSMPTSVLQKLTHGEKPVEVLALLSRSVTRLNLVGCDAIVIPCNTVHVFIEQLRSISKVPILSIIEEAVRECERIGSRVVAILASTTSIKEQLHIKELQKKKISCLLPNAEQQEKISNIIVNIVMDRSSKEDVKELISIIGDLQRKGADSVLLACTDLRTIISDSDVRIPIIETTTILENAAVRALLE